MSILPASGARVERPSAGAAALTRMVAGAAPDLTPRSSGGDCVRMAGRKWKIAAVAAALVVLASATLWYFESPAWTLKRMNDAAQSHDADALNAYIDYPALRDSLKTQLAARMITEARKDKSGLGALGMAVGSALMGPMVDRLVSAEGMRAALFAKEHENALPAAAALHVPEEPVILRRNFSEFLVTAKHQPNAGLVFKRHGLSWMLSGVKLPHTAS
jgi:hypothetical protein